MIFKSKLLWRLYAGYVAIILFCMLIVGILIDRQVSENSLVEIHHSLAVRSELLAQIAKHQLRESSQGQAGQALQDIIQLLGKNTDSRLTIIARDGAVVADSQELPSNMDNHGQRPEIIDAREQGFATSSRFSKTLQKQMMYRALRVSDNGQTIGFVRVSLPLAIIDDKLQQLRLIVLFGTGVSTIASLLLGFYFAKRFTDPLTRMTEIAEAISQGDYERRIEVQQPDEIGKLAAAVNRMARSSAKRMTELTSDRNRLAMIFTGMIEGVIAVDEEQKIIHINQAAATLLGLSMTACINKPIWEELRAQEIIQALQQAMETHGVVKTQMHHSRDADEQIMDIYTAALRNEEGNSIGAVIVLHDRSELDKLERVRRDFVANASHELKTPITAIRGLTETILDDPDMESDTRRRFIEKVHVQSLRLSSLVTDLMTISRLESGRIEQNFQPVNLLDLVQQSVAAATAACQEKQLSLDLQMPQAELNINADAQAINQLIDNLIDNAIKYTPACGQINVQVIRQNGNVKLSIEDTGVGISPQFQQRIFERFYRVDKARSRELGGTGLGLSIVRNICEQHDGSVKVDSQEGKGTTFTVILPLIS